MPSKTTLANAICSAWKTSRWRCTSPPQTKSRSTVAASPHLLTAKTSSTSARPLGYRIRPDYGAFPEQRTNHFHYRKVTRTPGRSLRGVSREGAIYQGLSKVVSELLARRFKNEAGRELPIERLLLDSGSHKHMIYRASREPQQGDGVESCHRRRAHQRALPK